jgi:hypothetical protein
MAYSGSISIKFLDIILYIVFSRLLKKSKMQFKTILHNLKLKFSKS